MNTINRRELPENWFWTSLGDVAEIVMGSSPPSSSYNKEGNGLPFFQGKTDFGPLSPTPRTWCSSLYKVAEKGDVLISVRAPVGPTNLSSERSCIGRGLAAIRPRVDMPSLFVLFYLRSIQNDISQMGTGSTFTAIKRSNLESLPFPLAPLNEQRRIVAKVEALFAESKTVREALEKVPVLLKRFRQSVLTKAFIGQLTNREANDISAPELVSRIKSQGPKSDSSLRTGRRRTTLKTRDSTNLAGLPEGWDWVKFKDVVFAQNGRSFPSRFYTEEGVRLLRPGNLHASGRLLWTPENTRYLPRSFSDRYAEFLIRENEIIMNLTAQSLKDEFLGRVCMTDQETCCLLNQRQARIRVTEAIDVRYLFWVLKSPIFRNFVMGLESGTLIQHMFTWQLNDFLLPLAPLKEQKKVVQRIEECLSYADGVEKATEAALNRVNRIDQSILSKAFRGELVPQNPNDEPASILLERMRAASHLDKSLQERH